MDTMNDRPVDSGREQTWTNIDTKDAETLGDEDAMLEGDSGANDVFEDDEDIDSVDSDGNPLGTDDLGDDDDLLQDADDIEDDLTYGDGTSSVESDVDAAVRRDVSTPLGGYDDVRPRTDREDDDMPLA
jgi:hypothetical protein